MAMESIDFSGTYNKIKWQGPAINTVLLLQGSLKTILMQLFPLQWETKIPAYFESRLLALNPLQLMH
jgi:hypothetical protein